MRNFNGYIEDYYFKGDLSLHDAGLMHSFYSAEEIPNFDGLLEGVTLYTYQARTVAFCLLNNRFYIGHDPGLGKTVIIASVLRYKMNKIMEKVLLSFLDDVDEKTIQLLIREYKRFEYMKDQNVDELYGRLVQNVYYTTYNLTLCRDTLEKIVTFVGDTKNFSSLLTKFNKEKEMFLFITAGPVTGQIARELWQYAKLDYVYIPSDKVKLTKKVKNFSITEHDGIVSGHSCLRSNHFAKHMTKWLSNVRGIVLDESRAVKNFNPYAKKKNLTTTGMSLYSKRVEYLYFMNGTPFELSLFELFNQFNLLNPDLLPTKGWFQKNFVVRDYSKGYYKRETIKNKDGSYSAANVFYPDYSAIAGYKNDTRFRNLLKFHYYGLSKYQVKDKLPSLVPVLVPVTVNFEIKGLVKSAREYNNPEGTLEDMLTHNKVLRIVKDCKASIQADPRGQIFIYSLYKKAQYALQKALELEGIRAVVINGEDTDPVVKDTKSTDFARGKYSVLISNIETGLNVGTADKAMYYSTPTNPATLKQTAGRIDRFNFDTDKYYYFYVYVDSPEVEDIHKVASRQEDVNHMLNKGDPFLDNLRSQVESLMERGEEEVLDE